MLKLKLIVLHCEVNKRSPVWLASVRKQIDGFSSDQVERQVGDDGEGLATTGYEPLQDVSKLIRTLQILSWGGQMDIVLLYFLHTSQIC